MPEAGLVVTGDNPDQGLTSFGERERVLDIVYKLGLDKQVRFLGQLNDEDLWACYAAADVQAFPLIDMPGDVEGFGMVATEAAACGTPTVAFNLGGVADAVGANNGLLIRAGNYPAFSQGVLQILQTGLPSKDSCLEYARQFGWEQYHERLREVIGTTGKEGERSDNSRP